MNADHIERTERELWAELAARDAVQGEYAPTIRTPWPIRLLMGAAGWLGAIFCQLFVYGFVFAFTRSNGAAMFVVGLVMVALAAAFYRSSRARTGIAAGQFALALSLSGQGMMFAGLSLVMGSGIAIRDSGFWLILAAMQAVLYWVVPNRLHRFLAALGTWSALTVALSLLLGHLIGQRWMMLPVSVGVPAAAALAVVAVFVGKESRLAAAARHGMWVPAVDASLLFGLGAALFVTGAAHPAALLFGTGAPWPVPGAWACGALLGLVLVAFAATECQRLTVSARMQAGVLGVITVFSILMIFAPAVTSGVLGLALALRRGALPWLGLSIATILMGFIWYYSTLQWTLLAKSITLVAAGVLLLIARQALARSVGSVGSVKGEGRATP
ncbi:DUF4401 domain-containing protein [Cupriavidus pampae]|uniref:DUF4401 domain-containing protein n=1 Tax=Cupriavidus pampae TaxID=659251 RepID=A0ABM8Y220_9BURK|nr:DUF4401 domain-containing protein [Cupriavidus pampae]CAG9186774.1 hypothetical protein LMG32289_06618 [Cupriavidus pampae]